MAKKKSSKKNEIEVVVGEMMEEREAPKQRVIKIEDVLLPAFNKAQMNILLTRTPEWAIKSRIGGGGKTYRYVPHGYVTDQLNKAFGFDWDLMLTPMENGKMYSFIEEEIINSSNKSVARVERHISVTGYLEVRIHGNKKDPSLVTGVIRKSGFGSQKWLPAMEFGDALKGARSDLVKTCAFQLGIGLDLYWNERAEYENWQTQLRTALSEKVKVENQLTSGTPNNSVLLLSMAFKEYGLDSDKVAEILEMPFDEILTMEENQVKKAWAKLGKHASK